MKNIQILILLFCISSCSNKEVKKEKKIAWNMIEISTRKHKVIIYKDLDTASYEKEIWKLISKRAFLGTYKLDKVEHKSFSITKLERDSLHSYVSKMFTNPTFSDRSCTDYVGKVKISMGNNGSFLSCEYNSVCEWTSVSPETQKIYDLLKNKVDISTK